MAKSFWAGFAKETTDILKESDDRAYDMISKSLQYQAEDIRSARKKRDEAVNELSVIAENLADLGLEDDEIQIVLSKGSAKASEFLKEAPAYAQARGIKPNDLIEISEGGTKGITVKELVDSGAIVGIPTVGSFATEMQGLPSAYSNVYQNQKDFFASTMGISEDEAQTAEAMAAQGRIKVELFRDIVKPDYLPETRKQTWDRMSKHLGAQMGVKYQERNGVISATQETAELEALINQRSMDWFDAYDKATAMATGTNASPAQVYSTAYLIFQENMKASLDEETYSKFNFTSNTPRADGTDELSATDAVKVGATIAQEMEQNDMASMLDAARPTNLINYLMIEQGMSRDEAKAEAQRLRQEHRARKQSGVQ
jgi:hypothetical protein